MQERPEPRTGKGLMSRGPGKHKVWDSSTRQWYSICLASFIQGHVVVGGFRVPKSLSELLAPSLTPTMEMMTDGGKF